MKAPEKLYLRKRNKLPLEVVRDKWCETDPQSPYGSVEYTRTDAFIAKVERFLEYNLNDRVEIQVAGTLIPSLTDKKTFIEDLKNYMKGE